MRTLNGRCNAQTDDKHLVGEVICLVLRPVFGELCKEQTLKDKIRVCTEILNNVRRISCEE